MIPLSEQKCNSFFQNYWVFFVDSRQFHPKVGDQKPEYPPDNRDSGHFLQGIGVSCHLPPVPLASLGQMLGGDTVSYTHLSAKTGEGLDQLLAMIGKRLDTGFYRVTLSVPYDKGGVVDMLYRDCLLYTSTG